MSKTVHSRILLLVLTFGLLSNAITILHQYPDGYVDAIEIPGGTINSPTTWAYTQSPYIVKGNITVTDALTIEAGVEVKFDQNTKMTIDNLGSLVAQGTKASPIEFKGNTTTPTQGFWGGLDFLFGSQGTFNNCTVTSASKAIETYMSGTNVQIFDCNITSNSYGISTSDSSTVTIMNSTIHGNGNKDVSTKDSSTVSCTDTHPTTMDCTGTSSITGRWHVDIKVVDVLGSPINDARVQVRDSQDQLIFTGQTPKQGSGEINDVVLDGFVCNSGGLDASVGDHTFIATAKSPLSQVNTTDEQLHRVSKELLFIQVEVNHPPYHPIPAHDTTVTILEESSNPNIIDLWDNFTDDGPITNLIFSNSTVKNITVTLHQLTGRASIQSHVVNWTGSENVTITATDPGNKAHSENFTIIVLDVNDEPVNSTQIGTLVAPEDGNGTVDLHTHFFDADADKLYFTTEVDPFNTSDDDSNITLSITPDDHLMVQGLNDWFGTIDARVHCGEGPPSAFAPTSYSVFQDFQVLLTPVGDPPRMNVTIPNVVFDEDKIGTLDLRAHIFDPDPQDTLRWYLTGEDKSLYSTAGENGSSLLIFTGKHNMYGNDQVKVFAVDQDALSSNWTIWINVTPVNDPPVIVAPSVIDVNASTPYSLDLSSNVSDVDNPISDLNISVNSSYVEINGFKLVFTYPAEGIDNEKVRITITDGNASSHLEITVRVNHPTRYNDILVMVYGVDNVPLEGISLELIKGGEQGGSQRVTNESGMVMFPSRQVGASFSIIASDVTNTYDARQTSFILGDIPRPFMVNLHMNLRDVTYIIRVGPIENEKDEPVQDAKVWIRDPNHTEYPNATTDLYGFATFTLRNPPLFVKSGIYEVEVRMTGYRTLVEYIELNATDDLFTFELTGISKLRVMITQWSLEIGPFRDGSENPLRDVRVELWDDSGTLIATALTSSDGMAYFTLNTEPSLGRYEVRFSKEGYTNGSFELMIFQITGDGEIDVDTDEIPLLEKDESTHGESVGGTSLYFYIFVTLAVVFGVIVITIFLLFTRMKKPLAGKKISEDDQEFACPACNAIFQGDRNICPECGAEFEDESDELEEEPKDDSKDVSKKGEDGAGHKPDEKPSTKFGRKEKGSKKMGSTLFGKKASRSKEKPSDTSHKEVDGPKKGPTTIFDKKAPSSKGSTSIKKKGEGKIERKGKDK